MNYITEPAKQLRIAYEADVFVAGGSCTGVFAAVRAARLGARVILVERQNCLGGTATAGLVNVWHSLKDTDYKNQVIAGLTDEMTARLHKSGSAVLKDDPSVAILFDPNALMYELDKLVKEEKITVLLHTLSVGAIMDGSRITAAIIENKDGRSAVSAGFFIDATGDGDLAKRIGLEPWYHEIVQPPTPCFLFQGDIRGVNKGRLLHEHGAEFDLPDDFGWDEPVPGLDNIWLRADHHVFDVMCDTAEGLTRTEMEGRRKAVALRDMINKYTDKTVKIAAFSSMAGIRETAHFASRMQACGSDMLRGERYEDAVLNGTYRIDLHDLDGSITFKYLSGEALFMRGASRATTKWNWREKEGLSGDGAKYYQIPFGVLVQEKIDNFIAAGRMLNADREAFGALRVMVNLNQLGEAAGTAAYLALNENRPLRELDGKKIRRLLRDGGSAL